MNEDTPTTDSDARTASARPSVTVAWRPAIALGTIAAIAVVALIVALPWIVATLRSLIVLATVLNVQPAPEVAQALTREPVIVDTTIEGNPTTIAIPAGDGPWPAVMFFSGASRDGKDHPQVQALGEGMARGGLMVFVPDLPGMRNYTFTPDTVDAAVEVADHIAARDDVASGGITIASVSAGASIAIVASSDEQLRDDVRQVVGLAPYADLPEMIRLATTGTYTTPAGDVATFDSDLFLGRVIGQSIAAVVDNEDDSRVLIDAIERADRDEDVVPAIATISDSDLGPAGRSIKHLLTNIDPAAFDDAFAALPPATRTRLHELSPVDAVESLDTPVLLASAPVDKYFPLDQSHAIIDLAGDDSSLTVTTTLHHAIPEASVDELTDLAKFHWFVVRVMRNAADATR